MQPLTWWHHPGTTSSTFVVVHGREVGMLHVKPVQHATLRVCIDSCERLDATMLQHGLTQNLHLTNLQFLPRTSCLGYSVSSMKPSDANTIGQSGKLGSQMTKFCWILSTVVARSSATRGKAFGAVMRLPITVRCFSSASCRPAWEVWYVWQYDMQVLACTQICMTAMHWQHQACHSLSMLHSASCTTCCMYDSHPAFVTGFKTYLHFADHIVIDPLGDVLPQPSVILDKKRNTSRVSKSFALRFAGNINLHTNKFGYSAVLRLYGGHGKQVPEWSAILPVIQ